MKKYQLFPYFCKTLSEIESSSAWLAKVKLLKEYF